MMKLLSVVAAVLALSACGEENKAVQQSKAAEPPPAIKLPPPKYYSMRDGLEYGYEQGISTDAANSGQVAPKLIMIKFLGERHGVVQFHFKEGAYHAVVQCERPCEFVKQMIFYDGELVKKEHMRAAPGSIAAAVTSDALNGHLEKFVKDRNGKPHELWFDEAGPKWTPVAAAGT